VIEEERRQFKKRKLELKEIKFEGRGIYTCTAENLLGRVQLSVNVTVKVPPKFVTKPKKSVTAYKSWHTVLKCDIFGYPFPVLTWTRSLKSFSSCVAIRILSFLSFDHLTLGSGEPRAEQFNLTESPIFCT